MSPSAPSQPFQDLPNVLEELAQTGLASLHLALTHGPVDEGLARMPPAAEPLFIVVLEGEATYCVHRDGRTVRLLLHVGDALLVWHGARLGVLPQTAYVSLGVRLLRDHTHVYIMRPGGPLPPSSQAVRVNHFDPQTVAATGGTFTYAEHLRAATTSAITTSALHHILQALVAEPDRPPDDVVNRLLVAALLAGVRDLLVRPADPLTSRARRTYLAARAEVDRECDQPISRESVAARLGIHANHLTKLFARFGDESFNHYLLRARLARATDLLADDHLSVKEVADACGFASASYFTLCFRQRHGLAPGAWRRRAAGPVPGGPAK